MTPKEAKDKAQEIVERHFYILFKGGIESDRRICESYAIDCAISEVEAKIADFKSFSNKIPDFTMLCGRGGCKVRQD